LSQAPSHARAHHLLGRVLIYSDRASEGLAECEHALSLDPNLADAYGAEAIAKYFIGQAEETEAHVAEALRLSPRDPRAYAWTGAAGIAKLHLGADKEAVAQLRRSIEANRNAPIFHLLLAAGLAHLGRLDEARVAARSGLALDPRFTIRGFRANAQSSNPTYLAQRERIYEGMLKAGVPEG
jgi:Flp pilus assembly protein TadD